MDVLHMTSPTIDDGATSRLSVVAGRLVAARHGRGLRLYDLATPAAPTRIPDVVEHALQPGALVVSDPADRLRRYEPHRGAWRQTAEWPCPSAPGVSAPQSRRLLLSPSARSLLVESSPIPTGPGTWPVARAFLLDAATGAVKRDIALGKTWVRANFGVLPGGEEVLFISAESYMSVQLVDCASGRLLHEYRTRSPGDF
ncbi:MAG TPA: hypothetical protein VFW96_10105, partial [Thermomicrobiales bacterium]|nr:hypothetical protein [Thermomicrobiales bacterium]